MNDAVTLEKAPSTDLVATDVLVPAKVFAPGGVDAILEQIAAKVRAVKTDISTAAGRAQIKSLAHKVSRSKTALDEMGKTLGQDHYDAWQATTSERAKIRTALDALRDEVRKPLTDWENAEQARVDAHQGALASLIALGTYRDNLNVADIDTRLSQLTSQFARDWQEFTVRATEAEAEARKGFLSLREATIKREAERAELERLRQAEAARVQKERDERIAAEAAERARLAAEAKAAAETKAAEERAEFERRRIEQDKAAAIARAEKADADR